MAWVPRDSRQKEETPGRGGRKGGGLGARAARASELWAKSGAALGPSVAPTAPPARHVLLPGEEVIHVDPTTGARKGVKPARFDLLPTGPLWLLAEHYGRGAGKYADHNWRKGIDWSKHYAALQRHLNAYWGGEDHDPDPTFNGTTAGAPLHLVAAAWHCLALIEAYTEHPDKDDRWKGTP